MNGEKPTLDYARPGAIGHQPPTPARQFAYMLLLAGAAVVLSISVSVGLLALLFYLDPLFR